MIGGRSVNGKATVYLLKIKCEPIAIKVGTDIGTFIVKICREGD
jgi:uncharacterized protein with ATP-grasp and redox domains